ncbi:MAG: hypothetical protein GWP08_09985 [Nitrospiraceae bacterium]|nr:hypothetical protein [Nitrospiraceae bacterium]
MAKLVAALVVMTAIGAGVWTFSCRDDNAVVTGSASQSAIESATGAAAPPESGGQVSSTPAPAAPPSSQLASVAAVTPAKGRFSITGCAAGDYAVIVTPAGVNGYSTSEEYLRIELAAGEHAKNVEIVYGEKGGLAIAGRVVNSAGQPVSKTRVTCFAGKSEHAYTKTDGAFMVTGLDDREYSLSVEHEDYSRAIEFIAAGTLDVEIVLKGRGRIEGRVLRADTGAPLPDYTLHYIIGRAQGWSGFSMGAGQPVESGDGTLAIPNLHAGEVSLAVRVPGFAPEWRCVTVDENAATEVEFRLEPVPPFEGLVVDESGELVAGAYVYYSEGVTLDLMDRTAAARTDEAGRFVIDSLPQDIERVCAYAEGYGVGVATLPGDGRIVLPMPGDVEGVIELEGASSSDVIVNTRYPDARHLPYGYVRPNPDGTFRLSGLTPGRMAVSVCPNTGTDRHSVTHEVLIESGQTAGLRFVFERGTAALEGALHVGGEPVTKAWLKLERSQGDSTEYIQSQPDANGAFRFEDIWAGDLVLTITRVDPGDPYEPIRDEIDVTLEEGQVLRQDVELEPLP